jgi:ABC-2 type transport system permease protein
MRKAIHSEWLKVRRLDIIGGSLAAIVVLSVAAVVLGLHELDRPRAHANIALYSRVDGLHAILAHSTDVLAIFGLGFAAFAFGTEFSSGTLRNLLVRQSNRLALFAGKGMTVAAMLAVAVVVAYAVALPAALVSAPHYGVSTSLWTTPDGARSALSGAGDLALSTFGYGVIGALLGIVLRSPALAIVVGLAYVYGVEALLTNAFASMSGVLFASQLDAIGHGGTTDVGFGHALLVAAAWVLGAIVIGGFDVRRRDVVA